MKLLEWSDAEKAKKIEVLEKKYQGVLDLNYEEYVEAQQEVWLSAVRPMRCGMR
jgi:hypothetical protein